MRFDIYSKKCSDKASVSLTTTPPQLLRMRQHAALTVLQLDRNSDTYGPYESWWFFCLMLPCSLLVTEVCRWILHVQLLFLLCNTEKNERLVGLGELLACF